MSHSEQLPHTGKTTQTPADLARLADTLRECRDRAEITDLVSRLGVYLDEPRIDDLDQIYTEDVAAQFEGGEPFQGLEPLQEHARANLPRWDRRQHVLTNVIVALDGDQASVRANLIATHVHHASQPASHWDIGGYYDFKARRTPDGWRLSNVALHRVWTAGADVP